MKKAVTVLLAVVMLLTTLAGCGAPPADSTPVNQGTNSVNATSQPEEAVKEHLDISVAVDDIPSFDDEVGQLIQEMFNVTITAMPIESDEALALWAAGDELPDMFVTNTFEDSYRFFNWIDQGIIRDVPYELISKYANIQRIVDGSRELSGISAMKDDKYWYIPRKNDANHEFFTVDGARIFYREDWLETLGMDVPTTIEDYYEVLYAMAHDDPTGTGASTIGALAAGGLVYYFALYGIDPEGWVYENDEWIPGFMSQKMVAPLEALRQLYSDKSLDNEYAISGNTEMFNKWANNIGGSVIRNGGDQYWYNRMHRYVSEAMDPPLEGWQVMDVVGVMPIPTAPDGNKYWLPFVDSGGVEFSADTSDEVIDRLLEMLDWTLTDEAMDYYRYGVEGITYEVNDEGKYVTLLDPATGEAYQRRFPAAGFISAVNWMSAENFYNDKSAPNAEYSEERIAAEAAMKQEVFDWTLEYNKHVLPEGDAFVARLISTPAKDEIYSAIRDDSLSTEIYNIISGTAPVDEMFEAFLGICYSKGIQDAIDEVSVIMNTVVE
jgi:putative aldouronate transport system substrate-binding protein